MLAILSTVALIALALAPRLYHARKDVLEAREALHIENERERRAARLRGEIWRPH